MIGALSIQTIIILILVIIVILLVSSKNKIKQKYVPLNELENKIRQKETEIQKQESELAYIKDAIRIAEADKKRNAETGAKQIKEMEDKKSEILVQCKEMVDKAVKQGNEIAARINKENADLRAKLQKEAEVNKALLEKFESQLDVIESGVYNPVYDFATSLEYKHRQEDIINQETKLIASDSAMQLINPSVNENSEIGKLLRPAKKLFLRTFNGESDLMISKVKWNNFDQVKGRIRSLFESLNHIGEKFNVQISNQYLDLKLQQLILEHEYNVKLQKEKDERREAQEELREEEKAQKELEKAQEEAKKEEIRYQQALEDARKEQEKATGEQFQALQEYITKLEQEKKEAEEKNQRAISMAQQTKRGHVYVISNIGSFGENVYKIGMTRRLEPEDRVKELGDASVPFPFDIHAMIYSEDAPKLETDLHNKFDSMKVNMVNTKREFFRVSLKDIEKTIKEFDSNAEFKEIPEAEEYRETLAILKRLKEQNNQSNN